MKMIKHFIPVIVAFVLVAGLLVAGHLKTAINNPPIVQASSKEASPTDKITDRRAFVEGVFFVQDMKYRALCDTKDILAGLDGVKVLVEALHPCTEKHGLTRKVLQTDAELRLRMHGIKVGTDIQPQHKKLDEQTTTDTAHSSIQNWRQAIDAESDSDATPYEEGMRRELDEEVRIDTPYQTTCVGLINDDQTEVGTVHLGVVYIFDVERPEVHPNETDIIECGFRNVDEILADTSGFETWSSICLQALFEQPTSSATPQAS